MMNHQSRRYHHHNHHHHHNYFDRFRLGQKPQTFYGAIIFAVIGLLSLIWFVIRTGKKPARITYPCQQIAATNSVLFLAWITSLIAGPMIFSRISHYPHAKFVKSGLIIFTLSIAGYTLYRLNPSFNFTALSANPVCPQNNCSS